MFKYVYRNSVVLGWLRKFRVKNVNWLGIRVLFSGPDKAYQQSKRKKSFVFETLRGSPATFVRLDTFSLYLHVVLVLVLFTCVSDMIHCKLWKVLSLIFERFIINWFMILLFLTSWEISIMKEILVVIGQIILRLFADAGRYTVISASYIPSWVASIEESWPTRLRLISCASNAHMFLTLFLYVYFDLGTDKEASLYSPWREHLPRAYLWTWASSSKLSTCIPIPNCPYLQKYLRHLLQKNTDS